MGLTGRSNASPPRSDAYRASVAYFEHSLDAVLFTAPDGRVLDANDAASRLLGMSREEICRRGRAGVADPTDDRWRAAVAERARTGRFVGPLSTRRGDGTTVELIVSSAVFTDADGEQRTVVVMRPPTTSNEIDDEGNVAVVDPTGIANRPTFIQLVEQQRRKAAREVVGVGLVYARLTEAADTRHIEMPSATASASLAAMLAEECGWRDVVGRVGPGDFAMLLSHGDAETELAFVRSLCTRMQAHNKRTGTHLSVHLGVKAIEPDSEVGTVELLDQAAASMNTHERQRHRASPCCFFALNEPLLIRPLGSAPNAEDFALTARELTVLRLVALGHSYREVSDALFISTNTVKTHVAHVYTKLGVSNRREARAIARSLGLLPRARTAVLTPATRQEDADRASGERTTRAASRATPETSVRRTKEPRELGQHLAQVARELTRADDADQVLDIVIANGLLGLNADAAIIAFIEQDMLVPFATYGYSYDNLAAFLPAPLDTDIPISVAARNNQAIWMSNPAEVAREFPEVATSPVVRSKSWVAMPLTAAGTVFGVLGVSFLKPHDFPPQERQYLSTVADLCALAFRALHEPSHSASTNQTAKDQQP